MRQILATPARGFTLIQLLVVMGIIVLLIGLLLPALIHARKTAARTATTADLATIGTALEHYKAVFGDYPRFTIYDANATNSAWLNDRYDRGAVLLCRCLLGPAPAGHAKNAVPATTEEGDDGADGFGFRATRTTTTYGNGKEQFTGKVYGPYIQSDKFPVSSTAANYEDAMLLDAHGNPILYYPGLPAHGSLTATGAYVASADPSAAPVSPQPLYNTWDNSGFGTTGTPAYLTTAKMQTIMGADSTGTLIAGKTAITAPYILWTAGPDGIYGLAPDGKTDDVTNFTMPLNLVK